MSDQARMKLQGEMSMDVSQVDQAFGRVEERAGRTAQRVGEAAKQAGKDVAGIGDGATQAAEKLTREEGRISAAIRRATLDLQALGKTASEKFELTIEAKGLDKAKFADLASLKAAEKEFADYKANLAAAAQAEKEFAEAQAFKQKVAEGEKARQAAEYVRFWTESLEQAEIAEKKLASENAFLNNLQRQVDAIGKSRADLLAMQAAQMGIADKAAPMIAKLREAEAPIKGLGVSAAQTAAAMRMVPAQFTDIVTSLQAGQAPFTVLLQQGGQLKDSFGGIGPAAKALGGYVLGLINPFTVAAAAAGALAVAYNVGSKEADAYARSLILTGNAAGLTIDQMQNAAERIAAIGATQHEAAAALAEFAGSTNISGQGMERFAAVAVRMQKETGQAVSETVKQFSELGKDPVAASAKLSETTRFLTAEVYKQIKALEDEGRIAEAALKAQDAYAEVMNRRMDQLAGRLGTIEKLWRDIKFGAKLALDAALDVGRPDTNFEAINKALKDREGLEKQLQSAEKWGDQERAKYLRNQLSANLTLINGLRERGSAERAKAQKEKEETEKTSRTVKLTNYLEDTKYADNKTRQSLEVDKENAAFAAAVKGFDRNSKEYEEAFARHKGNLAKIADQYKDKQGISEAGQVLKQDLEQQLKGFQDALQREREAIAFHNRFMQGEYQLGNVSLKAFFDDRRKMTSEAADKEIAELANERAALEEFIRKSKDPSDKVRAQTRINEIDYQQGRIRTASANELKLANQEEAASLKALNDQVANYRANLLQMQGDELGAAKVRAQVAIENAKILAKQAEGSGLKVDVAGLAQALNFANQFADLQNKSGLLAANAAHAEEAFLLVAERGGASLMETERGVYAVRSAVVEQLGTLTAKAKELAEASTDPRIKAFAADLALQYARATDAVDPALNRLREANKELARGLAGSITDSMAHFGDMFRERQDAANKDLQSQRDEYDKRIDQLEGYLAKAQDATDKARLRARIKEEQDKKAQIKGESSGSIALKTIERDVLGPMVQQTFASVNKLLVTDPMQKYLEGQFRKWTEGDGMFAKFFKDALGISDPKQDAQVAQTAAINASTTALDALTAAAMNVAGAFNGKPITPENSTDRPTAFPSMGDFTRMDRKNAEAPEDKEAAAAQESARKSVEGFATSTASAASDVAKLAQAAGVGGGALSRLPYLVNVFSSAIAAMTASNSASSGSGILSLIGSAIGLMSGSGDLQVETVESGAVSADYKPMPDFLRGGRAGGGTVDPNSLYRINEDGPEIFEMDGKQYLMTGARGGNVISNHAVASESAKEMAALMKRLGVERKEWESALALPVSGAREFGGPVSAGRMYQVNEKRPEVLSMGGRDYLMMGNQSGTVDPNPKLGNTQNININVHVPAGTPAESRRAAGQGAREALAAFQQAQRYA